MFRIKNIRGSTVGKANNLSPQVPQYKPEPKKQTVNNKINPQPQLNKINDPKIKLRPVSRNNKKVILPGAKDRTGNAKLNKIINDKLEGKFR